MVCSICLDVPNNPHVTPCGHIFCLNCLIFSAQKGPDAAKASCPTCRASFSLVTPDRMFVPAKYRPFIDSNIRRVFLDNSAEALLQEQVAQLEARVNRLEKDKDLLMGKCESHMAAAASHAQGEMEARKRCANLQKELKEANQCFATVIQNELSQTRTDSTHTLQRSHDTVGRATPSTLSPKRKGVIWTGKRESITGVDDRPWHISFAPPPPEVGVRYVAPLPKRRRVSRALPSGTELAPLS